MLRRIFFISTLSLVAFSCNRKGCTDVDALNYSEKAKKDDGSCIYPEGSVITLNFSHVFDAGAVNSSLFDDLIYANEQGNVLSITKLIYHISDLRFYKANGDSVMTDTYHYVDLSSTSSLSQHVAEKIPFDTYHAIGFNIGFTQDDNVSGAYSDLNALNWNWPESLGGGYHHLQLEGRFIETSTDTTIYAYHAGSTVREITVTDTIFHENHIWVKIPVTPFDLSKDATISLEMNVAEWFKNPTSWDLNLMGNSLMGDYNAQVLMRANGADVFSVTAIAQ